MYMLPMYPTRLIQLTSVHIIIHNEMGACEERVSPRTLNQTNESVYQPAIEVSFWMMWTGSSGLVCCPGENAYQSGNTCGYQNE